MRESPPYPNVVERLAFVVERQDAFARRAAHLDGKTFVGLELLDRLQGAEPWNPVDVAGQQRSHLRGRVVDEAEGDLVQSDLGRVAVTVVLDQRHRRALEPVVQLERPRADRLAGRRRRTVGMQDDGGVFTQPEGQHRVGVFEHQDDRVRVHHLHAADVVEDRLLGLVGAARGLGAVEAELDGSGVERCAIGKGHTLAQPERIGLAVGRVGPGLGQQRHHGAVHRDLGQTFKDVVVHHLANGRGRGHGRVQAGRFEHHAKHHGIAVVALRPGSQRRHAGSNEQRVGAAAGDVHRRSSSVNSRHCGTSPARRPAGAVCTGAAGCETVRRPRRVRRYGPGAERSRRRTPGPPPPDRG